MKKLVRKDNIKKIIPIKNYVIVLTVSVIVMMLTFYLRSCYLNYKNNKLNISYFTIMKVNEVKKNDFDFILSESSNIILYVKNSKNKDSYKIEKKIYSELEKNDFIDDLIYWDVTELTLDFEYINVLKSKFPDITGNMFNVPFMLVIKDGKVRNIINVNLDVTKNNDYIKVIKRSLL